MFFLPKYLIYVHPKSWKKLGYKGRVELYRRKWKFHAKLIGAYKTVQEAINNIPPVSK